MGTEFWAGIAIGTILSIIGGFFVNLQTERLQRWLESRRKVGRLRTLRWEKTEYAYILILRAHPHYATSFHGRNFARMILAGVLGLFWIASSIFMAINTSNFTPPLTTNFTLALPLLLSSLVEPAV